MPSSGGYIQVTCLAMNSKFEDLKAQKKEVITVQGMTHFGRNKSRFQILMKQQYFPFISMTHIKILHEK